MNKDEIIEKLKMLREQEFAIHNEICDLESQLAEMRSPFAIGDEISFRHGRTRLRGVVKAIRPWVGSYCLVVQRILKDGSLGSSVDVRDYLKPEKVSA